jgi:ABC-2 type transport system permease protein
MSTTPTAPSPTVDAPLHSVLSTGPRPRHASALWATLAFWWRALLKIKHLPEQLMEAVAIPITFTVMFTYLFGGAMASSTGEYLQFILPGTMVLAVLLITMYVGTTLHIDISKGVYDHFRSLPIWRPAPLVGAVLGETGRYLIASTIVIALGLAIGFRPNAGVLGVLAAVALLVVFTLSLSWIWIVLALVLRTPTAIMGLGTMVLFPIVLASNVFVEPQTMPGWLQAFVEFNPVSHLVTAERGLMSGTVAAGEIGYVLAASAALNAVFAPPAIYLYGRKQ